MVDRVEIKGEAKGATGPRDEEFAARAEAASKPPVEEGMEVQDEREPDRLYAGKYRSAEELEKAYSELQKKFSQPEREVAAAQDLVGESDYQRIQSEYMQSGSLSDETYADLEKRGISKKLVDQFISGQQALADRDVQDVYSAVGGESEYQDLIAWAGTALDADEISVFNAEVQSGDIKRAKFAVKSLHARRQAISKGPTRLEGRSAPAAGEAFGSMAQVVAAMRDPRYQSDPAYRAEVRNRIARSGNIE